MPAKEKLQIKDSAKGNVVYESFGRIPLNDATTQKQMWRLINHNPFYWRFIERVPQQETPETEQ